MAQKSSAVVVGRSSKHTRPCGEGRGRRQKDCFLRDRNHQLIENKGRASKNKPKTNLKQTRNEAKFEAKKSKNRATCAKRTEDPRSKEAGFNGHQGGYMNRGPGIGDASPAKLAAKGRTTTAQADGLGPCAALSPTTSPERAK